MPIEFIPNQPFIFSSPAGSQSCLNNDPRQGTQVVTAGDTICVQQKLTPCESDINCEPTLSDGAGTEALSTSSVSGGWSASGATASYDGTGGVVGTVEWEINDPTDAVPGKPYMIEFTIVSSFGDASIQVALDFDVHPTVYSEPGTYQLWLIASATASTLQFIMNPDATTASDTMEIEGITIFGVSNCWKDSILYYDESASGVSWSYTLDTDNFATYANGKFCSKNDGLSDIVNSTAYTNDGYYHGVTLTVTECTVGGVEVIIGGTSIGTTSGNGQFTFYGIPTDTSGELKIRKSGAFDGCISDVHVDDYGLLDASDPSSSQTKLVVSNSEGSAQTDPIDFALNDDRITWCFNVDDLTNESNPIELSCDILYLLTITNECDEIEAVTYHSETLLRYNPNGWPCTKVVQAWSEGYNLGFYFGDIEAPTFKLTQRLRVLRYNPKYPIAGEDYLYSNGQNIRPFAQRGKLRECHFDRVDESTHDVIATQIVCDRLYIDNYLCFVPTNNYEPEWGANGRYNLAQSRIEIIQENEPTIFNRTN